MIRVVLIRPWTDARAGGGCCGGEVRDGVCLDGTHAPAAVVADPVGEAYRRLRERLPGVDVQIVDAGNTTWLLPWTFRAVSRREGVAAGMRAAARSTTAGAVLVDGAQIGNVADLDSEAVVEAVREALLVTG